VAAIPESLVASDEGDSPSVVVDEADNDAGGARGAVSAPTAVAAFPTDSILAVIIV